MSLTLVEAREFADRAIERARGARLHVSVAVLNALGELVQLDRMDGAPSLTSDVAEAKARTALNLQKPTSEAAREFAHDPGRLALLEKVARFSLVPLPGGFPIVRDGVVVGAIGVSGADAKDEEIATAALR
ncbi:MAG TPA: heme-binding protein [Stellaceae bacterium]|nr:heme-binding protein [Stellaceae bacterium]